MDNYELVFASDNIYFIKLSKYLLEDYLKMYTDANIQKLLFKKSFTEEEILTWVSKLIDDNTKHIYSMIDKVTNNYIGNFEIIIKDKTKAEILLSITPGEQNKHYGTESIKAMIEYAKEKFKIIEFELYVKGENTRAIHCYQNIGFIQSGDGLDDDNIHMSYK